MVIIYLMGDVISVPLVVHHVIVKMIVMIVTMDITYLILIANHVKFHVKHVLAQINVTHV
jgi:hypothetical protein